ncbi:MAG: SET domain-containing protein [Thermoanaerobaculaceae bacterium]|nr:SET domain-containing protein [Thermoanaerobaculaceae bacterium]
MATSTIEVKQSAIEALGLLACRAFEPDEQIHRIVAIREITAEGPLRADLGERFDHCDYPDGKMVLIGFPSRHLNHSCNPNAYPHHEGDACCVVARRRVATCEEVTID